MDHIYASHRSTVTSAGILELHIADHRMIYCEAFGNIAPQSSKKTAIEYRSFHKVDKSAVLMKNLSSLSWLLLDIYDDIDDRAHTFISLLAQVWYMHVRVKRKQIRSNTQSRITAIITRLI